MKLFRSIKGWLQRLFFSRKKSADKRMEAVEEGCAYRDILCRCLEELSRNGTLHLKQHNMRNVWTGETDSMTDAYLFLSQLPQVRFSNIESRFSADDLFYCVRISRNTELVLTSRSSNDYGAVLSLLCDGKPDIQIRLLVKENQSVN